MTNNTINVPRELLENIVLCYNEGEFELGTLAAECHALLSATSPAGVDGWDVAGDILKKLSAAQAIIDGLRGEVADLRSMLATVSKAGLRVRTERDQHAKRIGELEAALEFACKSLAKVTSSDGSGHADIAVSVLRIAGRKEADASQIVESYKAGAKWRIDAALSAGKEWE